MGTVVIGLAGDISTKVEQMVEQFVVQFTQGILDRMAALSGTVDSLRLEHASRPAAVPFGVCAGDDHCDCRETPPPVCDDTAVDDQTPAYVGAAAAAVASRSCRQTVFVLDHWLREDDDDSIDCDDDHGRPRVVSLMQ